MTPCEMFHNRITRTRQTKRVMPRFLFVFLSAVYRPSLRFTSLRRRSISLLFFFFHAFSCRVSVSHVRALAVKTSANEVSADTVLLLNQWLPEKRENKPRCHNRGAGALTAEGGGRLVLRSPGDAIRWAWLAAEPPHLADATAAICHRAPVTKMEIRNLNGIPLTFSGISTFIICFPFSSSGLSQPEQPADG